MLITSAGYGTVNMALRNGVPFIMTGLLEDKPQVGVITQQTGVGIWNPAMKFEPAMIKESVETILTDLKYKKKAMEMKRSYEKYDPIEGLDQLIQERMDKFNAI